MENWQLSLTTEIELAYQLNNKTRREKEQESKNLVPRTLKNAQYVYELALTAQQKSI